MRVSKPIVFDRVPENLLPLLASLTGFVRNVKVGNGCLIRSKRDNGRYDWSVPIRYVGRVGNTKSARLTIGGQEIILKSEKRCLFTFEDRNRCTYAVVVTNTGRTHGNSMAIRVESNRDVQIIWDRIGC